MYAPVTGNSSLTSVVEGSVGLGVTTTCDVVDGARDVSGNVVDGLSSELVLEFTEVVVDDGAVVEDELDELVVWATVVVGFTVVVAAIVLELELEVV